MNTEITNAINASKDKAQYDTHAKCLLSQKIILAHILVKVIDEFKDMKPEQVMAYIEGDPIIGTIPVDPGLTNQEQFDDSGQRIVGLNTENADINEGLIRFDIVFYVRTKTGLTKIIINIEIQKDDPISYSLLNRAIFYVSRLISSQKERDFTNSNYDDIKQVFSIWVCMGMGCNCMSHFHLKKDEILDPYNWKGNLNLLNIVMIGIAKELPKHEEKYELHRLIAALLSNQLNEQQRLAILESEYNIPINTDFRKDVNVMCNLGQGIEDRAIAETTAKVTKKVILNMYHSGYSLAQIADAVEMTETEVLDIITSASA